MPSQAFARDPFKFPWKSPSSPHNGIVGEAALAALLAQWLGLLGVPAPYSTYGTL